MAGKPSQCFLFKTCGRNVENATFDCALSKENTLEIRPFVETDQSCQVLCQEVRVRIPKKAFLSNTFISYRTENADTTNTSSQIQTKYEVNFAIYSVDALKE